MDHWDACYLVRTYKRSATGRNEWLTCSGCSFSKTLVSFLRQHSPTVCATRRCLIAAGFPGIDYCVKLHQGWSRADPENAGAAERIEQLMIQAPSTLMIAESLAPPSGAVVTEALEDPRTLELLARVTSAANLHYVNWDTMFDTEHRYRQQGRAAIYSSEGQLDLTATDELSALLTRTVNGMRTKIWLGDVQVICENTSQ